MRFFEVADGRAGVSFDRNVNGYTAVWCDGARVDAVADIVVTSWACGATAVVDGPADDAVYDALRGLGWSHEGDGMLRCPSHA